MAECKLLSKVNVSSCQTAFGFALSPGRFSFALDQTKHGTQSIVQDAFLSSALWKHLKGKLVHATSPRGFLEILRSGALKPDTAPRGHKINPMSGLCQHMHSLSLSDLALPVEDASLEGWNDWQDFVNGFHIPFSVILVIDRDHINKKSLRYYADIEDFPKQKGRFIRDSECCCSESIPMSAVGEVIFVANSNFEVFTVFNYLDEKAFQREARVFKRKIPIPTKPTAFSFEGDPFKDVVFEDEDIYGQ